MAKGQKIRGNDELGSIEDAIARRDYVQARHLTALRLAHLLDATESARDAKSLAHTVDSLIDKCALDFEREQRANADNPLERILAEADTIIAAADKSN